MGRITERRRRRFKQCRIRGQAEACRCRRSLTIAGHHQFIFDSTSTGQVEKIANLRRGLDKIMLLETDFAGIEAFGHPVAGADLQIGGHALKPSRHIIYNSNNDFLHCDSHGSGPNPRTYSATIGAHLALTNTDFLVEV